MSVLFKHIQE